MRITLVLDNNKPVILDSVLYKVTGQPVAQQILAWDNFNGYEAYRYGYNGQNKVSPCFGEGNHTTAQFWEYDTRLGRRWNLYPVDQIGISNYAVNGLNPIVNSDRNGDDWYKDKSGTMKFDERIGRRSDMSKLGIKGNYQGSTFTALHTDGQGNVSSIMGDKYGQLSVMLGELNVATPQYTAQERGTQSYKRAYELGYLPAEDKLGRGAWHSPLARAIIPDKINFSVSGEFGRFVTGVVSPTNLTWLTRGDAGLYLTPTTGSNVGIGLKAAGSAGFSVSWYTGNSRDIRRDMLVGHTFGVSVSGAVGLGGSMSASYSPINIKEPFAEGGFINIGISGEAGVDVGPANGLNIQGNYQFTPVVESLTGN